MLPEAAQATKKLISKSPHRRKREPGWLSTRGLAEKLDVSVRTIERYEKLGIIEPAKRIRGRRFWPEDTEPKADAAEAAA